MTNVTDTVSKVRLTLDHWIQRVGQFKLKIHFQKAILPSG